MKTADLIDLLAADGAPVRRGVVVGWVAGSAAVGFAIAVIIVPFWLGFRSLGAAMETQAFWMKAAYTGLLAVSGVWAVLGLSRPGGRPAGATWVAVIAGAAILGLAIAEFLRAAPEDHLALWLGASWSHCPFRILALATPVYVAIGFGVRRLAPTRPTLAGAAAGLLAGALGAAAYQLHCPETGAMFIATWYSLGVALSAALGALAGRWWLRW